MEDHFQLPDRVPRYVRRLIGEYAKNDMHKIVPVLENSKCKIVTGTGFDNWNGGQDGHDVVFLVPDQYFGAIPLDQQNHIQSRITQDLNKASSSIENEYINAVHFEYDDDELAENPQNVDTNAIERLWQPNTLKLFMSHRDTSKKQAHTLADGLLKLGISSFVAHDSIEPDEEWQKEIEKALQSMDAMLAFITDDFFDSAWTNQELGFALARGIPIIALKLESRDPIGFIKDRQAIRGSISDIKSAVEPIYNTIKKRMVHSSIWRNLIISRFCEARSFVSAKDAAQELYELDELTPAEVQRIFESYNENSQLNGCFDLTRGSKFPTFLNQYSSSPILRKNNRLVIKAVKHNTDEGEIPF